MESSEKQNEEVEEVEEVEDELKIIDVVRANSYIRKEGNSQ